MAKGISTTISTVSGETVKVGKLAERTFRSVKVGDYLYTGMTLRGQRVFFYGRVEAISGNTPVLSFGSHGKTVNATIPKGEKVSVYRPI